MKKLSLFLLALSLPFAAEATSLRPAKYSCSNVAGVEEWTIYVDLNKSLAGFFDNDNTAVIRLKNSRFIETVPQFEYYFEGKDTGGGARERLRITFNLTKMSASVTFNPGTKKATTKKALNRCVYSPNLDLR